MPSLLREVLGDVLRESRVNQGRTLRQVSDAARVSLGYLSEVERGRKEASSELLSAICTALDVPLSQLLVESGEQLARREGTVAPASARASTAVDGCVPLISASPSLGPSRTGVSPASSNASDPAFHDVERRTRRTR